MTGLLIFSCSPKSEQPDTTKASTRIIAPQVTVLANLPDSSKPKVTLLAAMPKPKVVLNNKPAKTHSFIDKRTQLPVAPEVQGTGKFTTYTTDNGLASDLISCSMMDKTGAIWLGSFGWGASKYDGKTFTTYGVAQGLANNVVRSIWEDRKGNLWFGTDGGGVSKYDGKKFTTYTTAQGLSNNMVRSIWEDRKGNLWFGTMGGGVSKYDGTQFTTYDTAQGLVHNDVWTCVEDKMGNLWFGTDGGGVSKYDGKRFTTYTTAHGLASGDIHTILADRKGNLWFGTMDNGICKYDGVRFTTYTTAQGVANNSVLSCLEDRGGNLWFGTYGGGVSKYDGVNFTNFTVEQGLPSNGISSIIEDKLGNIWFSTLGGGISKYGGKSVTMYTKAQGLGNTVVTSISENKAGNLWFGTLNGGASKYDGSRFATYMTAQGLATDNIFDIMADKAGNLWFCTDGAGVSKYDGTRFTTYTTNQGLVNNYASAIIEDKSGNLWFGTPGGVSKFDGNQFTTYTTVQGLASNNVNDLMEDRDGNLWFCTADKGVSKYDGKQFTTYTTDQGLADNIVWTCVEDKAGNLWFGTEQGLSVISSDKLKQDKTKKMENEIPDKPLLTTFTTKDGLPDNTIGKIVEDHAGKLMIGTNLGMAILKQGIHSFGKSGAVELYSSATGYPTKSVFTLFTDSKGITWIATSSDKTGLVRFDDKAVSKTLNVPTLVLQTVKLNNETICWHDLLPIVINEDLGRQSDNLFTTANVTEEVTTFGRALSDTERGILRSKFGDVTFDSVARWYPIPVNLLLPYRHNSLSFTFNAIETSRNFMVKYQYKLDGYDDEWSSLTDQGVATFGNLYEGTYTFMVKARSPEGIWCKPVTYSFTVLPPWWRSWWAYVLYALTMAGAVWGLVAYRSRALRQENQLLEKKVSLRTNQLQEKTTQLQEKTSELETSLSALKATQTQLIHKEKMASLGELTAGIAHEIQNPLNFVNNFSELGKRHVKKLAEEQQKHNPDPTLQAELLAFLTDSLQKIHIHGSRAASIVKGMLDHSRTSTGKMEPTDLNQLSDEFLRLAYHGMRTRDTGFNCELVTQFDVSVGKVVMLPQEMGQVLLNLFNNAFYAVRQQQTVSDATYRPTVNVTTRREKEQIVIRVTDNGVGMSDEVQGKIFQPFFTTKPSGQGTGLGMSLSYDIITKGHGGSLTFTSQEGQGTEFVLRLLNSPTLG